MISIRLVLALLIFAGLSLIDIRERRVPRAGQLLLLVWAVCDAIWIPGGPDHMEALLGIVFAGFAGYAVFAAGKIYSKWRAVKAEAFGLGDVRVLAFSGAILGIQNVVQLLWRSAIFGGLLSVSVLLIRIFSQRPISRELTIPYLPPIALAVCSLIFELG